MTVVTTKIKEWAAEASRVRTLLFHGATHGTGDEQLLALEFQDHMHEGVARVAFGGLYCSREGHSVGVFGF